MSPSATTLVRVPADLHVKLKALAHLRASTMVDLLREFVRSAEAAGELPPDTSTFGIMLDLDQDPPRIVLSTGGATLASMTPDETREFADKLDMVAARGGRQWVVCEKWQVEIRRVGTGIVLERQNPLPELGADPIRRSLNKAFALDLAARLRASV